MTAVKRGFTVAAGVIGFALCGFGGYAVETYAPQLAAASVVNEDPALPACEYEDSDNCYWDASSVGNGEGISFVTLNGVTYYEDQPEPEPEPVAAPDRRTVTLNGVTLEYVDGVDAILYCDQPYRVGIDVDNNGNEWAGCM
jgi:hypothetical protein